MTSMLSISLFHFQIHAMLKEVKLSNVTIQIEKEVFFQHLNGLGADMGQIRDSKRTYRSHEQSCAESATCINIEKVV